jgi:hypothetical protein
MTQQARENSAGKPPVSFRRLFAENRGIIFDILIFLVNVFLMRMLTERFVSIAGSADSDPEAGYVMTLFCLGIFILPPLGAILKRYRFHQRLKGRKAIRDEGFVFGCLFNPIFYFCLNILIISAINAFVLQAVYPHKEPGETLFVSLILGGLGFAILQTYLVYRFFTPPKREPRWGFLRSPQAELIGDLCVFVNMILYQVAINAVFGGFGFGRLSGIEDFFGRLFLLCFVALLIYFPPRILFLAEDIKRPATWLTILLANSPLISYVLFGTAPHLQN